MKLYMRSMEVGRSTTKRPMRAAAASPYGNHPPFQTAVAEAHISPNMAHVHASTSPPTVSYQAVAAGPPRTPPRSSSAKKKRRKSKSGSKSGSGSRRSSLKSKSDKKSTAAANRVQSLGGGGVTGITSSIQQSLSQLSLFSGDDTGDDEDNTNSSSRRLSLAFGNPDDDGDDDPTSAHHRAELYGALGGPTGMIGAFGDRRGCKRILVLITLAFILLSFVLESAEQGREEDEQAKGGGGGAGDNTGGRHGTNDATNITIGEIGELDPGKCRQIIDRQSMEVDKATVQMDKMAAEIRRLERQVAALQSRVQEETENGGKRGRSR